MVLAPLAPQPHPWCRSMQVAKRCPRTRLGFVATARCDPSVYILRAEIGRLAAHGALGCRLGGMVKPLYLAVMKATKDKRPDWSRRLPQTLVIPRVMTLRTLDDVRKLMSHLPEDRRELSTWQHVAAEFANAAAGGDIEGAVIALRMVLILEHVECRPR